MEMEPVDIAQETNKETIKETDEEIGGSSEPNYKVRKKILFGVLIVLALCLVGFIIYGILVLAQGNNNTNNNNVEVSNIDNNIDGNGDSEEDVYAYAYVACLPGDGTAKEYYKILELHKNGKDAVLASYDVDKRHYSSEGVAGVGRMQVFDNKIYYTLRYFDLSTSIMYIDLNNKESDPIELLKVGGDKRVNDFVMTDDYIYLNTPDSFYKYDIDDKEFSVITKDDYIEITYQENKDTTIPKRLYTNGKELVLNNKELVYDGETIYVSSATTIKLRYSFDGDITILELSDCDEINCDVVKNYKYNFDKRIMEEIEGAVQGVYDIYEIHYLD